MDLQAEYDNRARTPEHPGIIAGWARDAAAFREACSGFAEVTGDTVGSTVARVAGRGEGPSVAIIGHIDEIGLIVTHIDDAGFLWFAGVGGWDPVVLVGQRVTVATRDGAVPGAEEGAAVFQRACVSAEFRALGAGKSSPVTTWLRALARLAHEEQGGPGVGAIGMCFTGNFALTMMLESSMLARVLSQPSLPLDDPARVDLTADELAAVRRRLDAANRPGLPLRRRHLLHRAMVPRLPGRARRPLRRPRPARRSSEPGPTALLPLRGRRTPQRRHQSPHRPGRPAHHRRT